jgi:hypothetical protein
MLGPYPESDESSPHLPTLFPKDPFSYYPTVYACVFRVVISLQVFRAKFYMRAIWKVRGLVAVRRCYAEEGNACYAKL